MAYQAKPLPAGYHNVNPLLIVKDADRVIAFLKQAFDAQESYRMNWPDGKVAHAEVRIGDSAIMLSEARGKWHATPASIYVYVEDVDAAFQRAVQAGGSPLMDPANQFFGDRQGGVKDLAGNQWWIATHIEDVPREEMGKRARRWLEEQSGMAG